MLILARKSNESIIIGDDIRITILEIRGENVRLGIEAPGAVKILREELYEAVREENARAGAAAGVKEEMLDDLDEFI